MADLIDSTRANQAIFNGTAYRTLSANETTLVGVLIDGVTKSIARYLKRALDSQTYDELYDGAEGKLILRQYPVQSVAWVRYEPQTVLEIQNTDTATNQQARVAVTSTNLVLTRVASSSTTTNNLALGTYTTLQSLATQVIATGSGWTARALGSSTGDYGLWPSADLYMAPSLGDGTSAQGALNARGAYAQLKMHVRELSEYRFSPAGWIERTGSLWIDGSSAFFHSPGYWRVKYTAGYTTVPEDVQQAAATWVAQLFWEAKRDPGETQGSVPSAYSRSNNQEPPAHVRKVLDSYRRRRV